MKKTTLRLLATLIGIMSIMIWTSAHAQEEDFFDQGTRLITKGLKAFSEEFTRRALKGTQFEQKKPSLPKTVEIKRSVRECMGDDNVINEVVLACMRGQ